MSDRTSPDSTKVGGWLFRHRTSLPIPVALALLGLRVGEASPSMTLVYGGAILTVAGEALRVWAVHHIGAISRTRSGRLGPLIDSGPFGLARNPLYVGNILLWTGFALTARLVWMAPVILVLLGAEYHAIVRWEEQLLASTHGDAYRDYCARVPRWRPTLRHSTAASTSFVAPVEAKAFSWRETLFSERGTLIAIAAGYVLLWIKARF